MVTKVLEISANIVGRVYGWEATTEEVDDWVFDDITKTFIVDGNNRKFLKRIILGPWKKCRGV